MYQPKVTGDQELKETAAAGLFPLFTAAPFFCFPVDENYRYGFSYLHLWWAIFLFVGKSPPRQKFYLSKQTRPKPNKANKCRNTSGYGEHNALISAKASLGWSPALNWLIRKGQTKEERGNKIVLSLNICPKYLKMLCKDRSILKLFS